MPRFLMLVLVFLVSVPFTRVWTDENDTLLYKYPTEIEVTAPRMSMPLRETPFSTSIIGYDVMRDLPRSIAIDEPMRLVPGVKVDNQANGSRVHLSVRGQGILTERGIRGIKILLDDIPVNDPTGFAPDFFDVDFSTVDRIEVLRGPAASLYGGSASGGIINISTLNSPDVPLFGEASALFGSNRFWKGNGQCGGAVQDLNYRVSFSRMMGDGFREHTHFWGNTLYGKATYAPGHPLRVTAIFDHTHVYHENPEGVTLDQYRQNPKQANPDAIPFNEFLETQRSTGGLQGLVIVEEAHVFQFNGYAKRTLFTEANNRTFNHRTIVTPGGSFQYTYGGGDTRSVTRNKVSVGADVQWQTIDERRNDNLYSVEGGLVRSKERITQRGIGLFIIDKVDIAKVWGIMASVRHDRIHNELNDLLRSPFDLSGDADFSRTTGRVGVTFSPAQEANLFANWGQGFLPPATEELAQNPDHFGGFNTHLTFATLNGVDLGVRGVLKDNLYYDATVFYLKTENDFDRYRIPDPLRKQETFYRNAGSTRRLGLELYGRYSPLRTIEVQLAYTYSNFKYTIPKPIKIEMDDPSIQKYILDGNWLPNSPHHQLHTDIQYNLLAGLSLGFSTETLSRAFIDGANVEAEAVEGYTLLHVRMRYTFHLADLLGELSLNVRNIGNEKYVAFTEPDPGGNAYQPGVGREVFAGLKFQF